MYDYSAARQGGGPAAPTGPAHPTATHGDGGPSPGVIAAYKEEAEKAKEALTEVLASHGSSGVLEGKYLAKLKKCRSLTVELESERTRGRLLMMELETYKQQHSGEQSTATAENRDKPGKGRGGGSAAPAVAGEEDGEEADAVKEAKERAARAYQQLREKDLQLEEVRREKAQLRALVSREVGKPLAEVDRMLAGSGEDGVGAVAAAGWKGRAEQISLLRGRVKDLERSLASTRAAQEETQSFLQDHIRQQQQQQTGSALGDTGGDDMGSLMVLARQGARDAVSVTAFSATTAVTTAPSRKDVDEEARQRVSALESRRLGTLRDVQATLEQRTEELRMERQRCSALQARFSTLQDTNAQLKSYITTILDKSGADDELIEAYRAELEEGHRSAYRLKQELVEVQGKEWAPAPSAPLPPQRTRDSGADDVRSERSQREVALLRKRITALESELAERGESHPRAEHTEPRFGSALAAWLGEALQGSAVGADGSPTEGRAGELPVILASVGEVLRLAHGHLLAVEASQQSSGDRHSTQVYEQYSEVLGRAQQFMEGRTTAATAGGTEALLQEVARLPSLEEVLVRENSDLKARVKSLAAVLWKEGQTFALLQQHQRLHAMGPHSPTSSDSHSVTAESAGALVTSSVEYVKLKQQYEDLRKAFNGLQMQSMDRHTSY